MANMIYLWYGAIRQRRAATNEACGAWCNEHRPGEAHHEASSEVFPPRDELHDTCRLQVPSRRRYSLVRPCLKRCRSPYEAPRPL